MKGYIQGATDARADLTQWYILKPGQGFAHQTREFAMGYVRGFCSISPETSSDAVQASWDCAKGPTSASWVTGN